MQRFRASPAPIPGRIVDLFAVGQVIDDTMRPGNFFVAKDLPLSWSAARSETVCWEIFRGRLVEPTRQQRTFLSWHVEHDGHPVLSVKLDVHARQIHVVRGFLAHVWEGYDAGGGAIESRESAKWTRELVGTLLLADFPDLDSVRDELMCLIWQAVVGTSRLPLHSVEAPLPAFSFGHLHYVFRDQAAEPAPGWKEFLNSASRGEQAWMEHVKLVEFGLRSLSPEELPELVRLLANSAAKDHLPRLLRSLFNDVSLSPYTHFVDNALALSGGLTQAGVWAPAAEIDFLSHLLRQLCRHLTAYDLVTFHHRGANYPDALLLDAALKRYLQLVDRHPSDFLLNDANARLRRRALRQACLTRRQYEGHPVPDLPTSPGENARVLPASHPRVPEAQILQPIRRRRQLYREDPIDELLNAQAHQALAMSIDELAMESERTELGLGVFIDRPLGHGKSVGEPDLTPLLAHEAFSASLARRRWHELKILCRALAVPTQEHALDGIFEHGPWPVGLSNRELFASPRPVVALSDVRKVAEDFVILRTLPGGSRRLFDTFDWQPLQRQYALDFLAHGQVRLCVQALDERQHPVLAIFDAGLRRRLELVVETTDGYRTRAGIEWPRAGLRLRTVWDDHGRKHEGLNEIVTGR